MASDERTLVSNVSKSELSLRRTIQIAGRVEKNAWSFMERTLCVLLLYLSTVWTAVIPSEVMYNARQGAFYEFIGTDIIPDHKDTLNFPPSELHNNDTAASVDVSGWKLSQGKFSHRFHFLTLPKHSTLPFLHQLFWVQEFM